MGFLNKNLQTCKMQLSALSVFKTPEITSTVEFFLQKKVLTGFLQNNCSKLRLKLPGMCASVLEKDFTMDVFFIIYFELEGLLGTYSEP